MLPIVSRGPCGPLPSMEAGFLGSSGSVGALRHPFLQRRLVMVAASAEADPTTSSAAIQRATVPMEAALPLEMASTEANSPLEFALPKAVSDKLLRGLPLLSKSTELLTGRLAMFGFAASLIGEILTGHGPIRQMHQLFPENGWDIVPVSSLLELDPLFLFVIAFNLTAAVLPAKGRFVPEPHQDMRVSLLRPGQTLAALEAGFTKELDLLLGRVAQLGLAISLIGEAFSGKGVLGQVNIQTGVPLCETDPLLLFFIFFTLKIAAHPGSGKFIED